MDFAPFKKKRLPDGNWQVTFLVPSFVWADEIDLRIDHDGWQPHPMTQTDAHLSSWTVTIVLSPGRHCFFYLVDQHSRLTVASPDGHSHNDLLNLDCSVICLSEPSSECT